ncbi:MAG: AMP-binding protein [Chloroflexota bacterium]|jgi:long-chain acyl-CoA synthetase
MKTQAYPDPSRFDSLVELLDDAAERYPPDRPSLSLHTDEGVTLAWSSHEIRRRSRLVAWRLRAMGLKSGDRLLTWSPSTPALPAVYWGAMLAGVTIVPLDLRMAPAVLRRIADQVEADWLAIGTGLDAPDPVAGGLDHLSRVTIDELVAEPSGSEGFPSDWESQLAGWPRPTRSDLVEIIYTSGTTGRPKGVQLTHSTFLNTLQVVAVIVPPRPHRLVSFLPLSHLFEQAIVLFYGTMIGAEVAYVRSRTPRTIFTAMRELRATTIVAPTQFLQLFWTGLSREVDRQGKRATFDRLRRIARHLPLRARRLLFRSVLAQLGGALTTVATSAAYLPPELQQDWEDLGIRIVQGYGSTEAGPVTCNTEQEHPAGVVGRAIRPVQVALAPDSEILVSGPTVTPGYWRDPEATAAAFDDEGWYHTGDIGRFDEAGRLVLTGRKKNIIVLPNGLNVFPEDIESVLADHGLDQAVVLETAPGRIEAVVMPPGTMPMLAPDRGGQEPRSAEEEARARHEIERIVDAANDELAVHQRIDAWRMWPERDFPRTHLLKVRRDPIREWAGADVPLAVREDHQRTAVGAGTQGSASPGPGQFAA